MWVGIAMGIVGFVGFAFIRGLPQAYFMAGTIPYENVAFYAISVVPMFIFMGLIIAQTGIGTDLYYSVYKFVGQFRGGLASATVFACALLAAITGTGYAGIIVMSKVALTEMRKYKYDEALATGTIISSATMGILIPPSIAFVMYGILTEQPIGKLFMAGIIPGIIQAFSYVLVIYILCRLNPDMGPPGPKTSIKEKIVSLKNVWAIVTLFLIVIGGIYGGVFTPTEAGAVGAFGSIVIAFVMRRLSKNSFLRAVKETAVVTGMVLLMLIGTFMFMQFVAISRLPFAVGEWVVGLGVPNVIIIAVIIIIYIILGGPLPELPLVMLTIPIFFPVVERLGFSPIWFGVIIVRMLEIGSISPPVGQNIFVMSGISGIPIGTIFKGVIPFIIADILSVALLVAFPILSLLLPNMMR
jgi:tripartite ATP-independent transporter DctM subunit